MSDSVSSKKSNWFSNKFPHPLVLLFLVIVAAGVLTYIVPAGEFDRVKLGNRTVVSPDSFHYVTNHPVGVFDFFRAVPNGMIGAASIMFLVLIVGGAIEVFTKTGAINMGLAKLVNKFGDKGGPVIIAILMLYFAVLGGFLGWIEASIPFIPIAIAVAVGLGYDSLVGVGIAVLGAVIGFTGGPTNIYTVGIAHEIAELPIFSGIGFRLVVYGVLVSLAIHHVIRYANKIKRDPNDSLMKGIDTSDLKFDIDGYKDAEFTIRHKLILLILFVTFGFVVYGMTQLKWNINDMSAMFLLSGVIAGIISRLPINVIGEHFAKGASKIVFGALIVGVARGIQWILNEGGITDTIIYNLSVPLSSLPGYLTATGMFFVQTIINFFIPSGSGQAMAVMPIMIPLADLIGVTRQTAVLAFQLGDGFSNILWFTYGGLMVFLSYGKVPYNRWIKFVWPFTVKMIVASIVFIVIATQIHYGPF